ncbi:hypothetical protein [Sphingomonas sp.]|uniref:hypothetical protein n=1 Tax=Sphingomonas sp. TaxID=28214 RepID=UPI0035B38CC6
MAIDAVRLRHPPRATLPNAESITRHIVAVLLKQEDTYQFQNRHMQIKGMATRAASQSEEVTPLHIMPETA